MCVCVCGEISSKVSATLSKSKDKKSSATQVLHDHLNKLVALFPSDPISVPLNPRLRIQSIRVRACRFMGSKKVPLWLVFENADPYLADARQRNFTVLFKCGDDLRQDILSLQIIRTMDRVCQSFVCLFGF